MALDQIVKTVVINIIGNIIKFIRLRKPEL